MSILKDAFFVLAIIFIGFAIIYSFHLFYSKAQESFIEENIIIDGNFLIYKGELYEKYLPEHAQIGEKDAD